MNYTIILLWFIILFATFKIAVFLLKKLDLY